MSVSQQRRVIATSAMVVFALGFLNAAGKQTLPTPRFFVGIGFTFTVISIFADMGAGQFGAGLAILILISATLYEGEDVLKLITRRGKGEQIGSPKIKRLKKSLTPIKGKVRGPSKNKAVRKANEAIDSFDETFQP